MLDLGRAEQARAEFGQAVAIRQAMIEPDPGTSPYLGGLAAALRGSGRARIAEGDAASGAADLRLAIARLESIPERPADDEFELAYGYGLLAVAENSPAHADRAMEWLRRAVASGSRDSRALRTEAALDALRERPDFRLLMADRDVPSEPFAKSE